MAVVGGWTIAMAATFGFFQADVAEIAAKLLDEKIDAKQREALIAEHKDKTVEIVREIVRGLRGQEAGGKEEYRRIPWIWRTAVAAGRRNDGKALAGLLQQATPRIDRPLRDWRVVVLGGGVVGGISTSGNWPKRRINELLKEAPPELAEKWNRAVELAIAKADDEKVHKDTRYDCLRLGAMGDPEKTIPWLNKYLGKEVHHELQQGAIAGLSDIESTKVGPTLLAAMGNFEKESRDHALNALLRTDGRAKLLLDEIEAKKIPKSWFGKEQKEKAHGLKDAALRERITKAIGE